VEFWCLHLSCWWNDPRHFQFKKHGNNVDTFTLVLWGDTWSFTKNLMHS